MYVKAINKSEITYSRNKQNKYKIIHDIYQRFEKKTVGVVNSVSSMLRSPVTTVKPVCNDHLYKIIYYLWFIQ